MMQILMMAVQPSANLVASIHSFQLRTYVEIFSYSQQLDMSGYHTQNICNPQEYFDDEA